MIAERVQVKPKTKPGSIERHKKVPWQKRRLGQFIKDWGKNVSKLEGMKKD